MAGTEVMSMATITGLETSRFKIHGTYKATMRKNESKSI